MNRKDRRAAKADARGQAPDLDLRPGAILAPLAGTTLWGPDGEALGTWGVTLPIRLHMRTATGIRPMTPAKERLARRVLGEI